MANKRALKPKASRPGRAVRRKTPRQSRGGFSFMMGAFSVLLFTMVYVFAGRYILPEREAPVFPAYNEIFVTFLDVGQGDSILIRSAENIVLIDGGEFRARGVLREYFRGAGITRICYVVATHPHSDHIGGLVYVLGRYEVGRLLMPDVSHDTVTFGNFLEAVENNNITVHNPVPGERISAGIIGLEVIAPPIGFSGSLNDASIVLRKEHGLTSFLFTGDAEAASERQMLASGANLRANVLKVGHHGSRTSTTEEFLSAVAPTAAVIQSGAGNQFGHPHREVTERLYAHGVTIFRNDELGTIRMITNGQNIYLHT